jgi:hypothetical protein
MHLLGTRLRLRRHSQPMPAWRPVGCSAYYDVFAVEQDGEVYLGSCYRFGGGPDSWHCHSAFDTVPFHGRPSRQDCLWDLVRLYRTAHRGQRPQRTCG